MPSVFSHARNLSWWKELPVQKKSTDVQRDKAVKMNITQKWICAYIISFISISKTQHKINSFVLLTQTLIEFMTFNRGNKLAFVHFESATLSYCACNDSFSHIRSEQFGISFRLIKSIYAYNWPLNACFFSEKEQRSSLAMMLEWLQLYGSESRTLKSRGKKHTDT